MEVTEEAVELGAKTIVSRCERSEVVGVRMTPASPERVTACLTGVIHALDELIESPFEPVKTYARELKRKIVPKTREWGRRVSYGRI